MSIYAPSFVLLCLFTISNYFSASYYLGLHWHVPLILGAAALCCHILENFGTNRKIFRFGVVEIFLLCTLLLFAYSTFFISYDFEQSLTVFDTFYKGVLLYILVANVIKSPKQFQVYFLLLSGCAFFLAYRVLNYGIWESGRVSVGGSALVTEDPNYLALVLAYSIPFIVATFLATKRKKNIVIILLFIFVLLRVLQGFLSTESRGGFLALTVGCLVAFWMIKGINKKILTLLLAIPLLIIFGIRYVPIEYYYRMQEIVYPEADGTGSASNRVRAMKASFAYLINHPISDYGLGNHSYMLADEFGAYDWEWYREDRIFRGGLVVHSFPLQVGADTGFIPLMFYMGFIFTLIWRLKNVLNFSPHSLEDQRMVLFSKSLIIAFAIFCSGGFFLPVGYQPYIFYLGGLAEALHSQYEKRIGESGA